MNAARASPPCDAAAGPQEHAQIVELRHPLGHLPDDIKRTHDERARWIGDTLDANARLRRASDALAIALRCHHPPTIGAAFEAIDGAKVQLDDLIDEALSFETSASRALLRGAVIDYRAERRSRDRVASPSRAHKGRPNGISR